MPSLEELEQIDARMTEIDTNTRKELGVGPLQNISSHINANPEYQKLRQQFLTYDPEIMDQFMKKLKAKVDAAANAKHQARQETRGEETGFGGRRRRSKKSKRKQRKTRRR
jgi:hypothetical protein